MRKRQKRLRWIIFGVCAAIILVAAVQVVRINLQYPKSKDVPVQKNETVTFLNIDITYTDTRIDTLENTCAQYGIEIPIDFYAGNFDIEDVAAYCMDVTFENTTSETQHIYPYYFYLMQGDFSSTLCSDLYFAVNNVEKYKITLEPGEKTERVLTYALYSESFSEERWANILDLDYEVLFGLYPDKIFFVA